MGGAALSGAECLVDAALRVAGQARHEEAEDEQHYADGNNGGN
jgi:hypothetical protein